MKILAVNDDGYNAPGIEILSRHFRNYGEVTVVAPHIGQSGASSSITVNKGFAVHKHNDNLYSVEGTPGDCVNYALYGLKINPDIVVSGINNGLNIGIDTIYSGTIGAAMEALFHSKLALAFSCDFNYFSVAEREIDDVIDFIFTNKLMSYDYLLNINFPRTGFDKSKGIIISDLEIRRFSMDYKADNNIMKPSRTFDKMELTEFTDLWAYKNGYTSVTPLKLGNGDETAVKKLREIVKERA